MSEQPSNPPASPPVGRDEERAGFLVAALARVRRVPITTVALTIALCAGAAMRLYNPDWDEGKMLHPDERFVTVLTGQLAIPDTLGEFFDPARSRLNPFNTDWGGAYVYGTLPLFVVRFAGESLDSACAPSRSVPARWAARLLFPRESLESCSEGFVSRWNIGVVGRAYSALSDLASVLLLFFIGRRLFCAAVGALAAAFSAFAVFQIQQAHFFTVDAPTNFLVVLALLFCVRLIARSDFSVAPPGAAAFDLALHRTSLRRGTRAIFDGARRAAHCVAAHWAFDAAGAGVASGLATASKLNAVLLAPLIVLAIVVVLFRDERPGLRPLAQALVALVVAGTACFAAFRVAQPYAFVGSSAQELAGTLADCGRPPAEGAGTFKRVCHASTLVPAALRPLFTISSRWAKQIDGIQAYVSGEAEAPFTHQWANRMDYVFPLQNIVFWGLGPALGIAAIGGFFYMAWQLWNGWRYWAHAVPVLWTATGFFSFAAASGKTMRYFLPIYPTLALCAAVGLHALWRQRSLGDPRGSGDRGAGRKRSRWLRLDFGRAATLAAVAMTASWAWAFLAIYRAPVTRIAASRWIFEHIPSALVMTWDGGAHRANLMVKEVAITPGETTDVAVKWQPDDFDGAASVTSPSFVLSRAEGSGTARVRLFEEGGKTPLGTATVTFAPGESSFELAGATLLRDRQYRLQFDQADAPIRARTSVIATEHWDDAVPTGVDGKDGGWYFNSLQSSSDGQIQNYAEDEPGKLEDLIRWLDEADYISMSSNRLYGSIPRLPWRFPMTTEYYRALMNGELGFELLADHASFPRLGPLVWNSQEMAQPLRYSDATAVELDGIEVPYPVAEEAFSVYDHPRVLLFRKTPQYSSEALRAALGKYDLTRVIRQRPIDAIHSPRGLLFDERTRAAQKSGGTFRELFPPESPLNRSPALAWLAWLGLLVGVGVAAFPILFAVLRRDGVELMVDGGYALAKTFGLLATAYTAWLLASLKLAPFTAPVLWVVLGLLAAVGGATAAVLRRELGAFLRARWKLVLASELVFLIAFIAWTGVRIGNPDLWHPAMGGEKPMDFAYLNGVLRSTFFPAIDPWFTGGYLNYYYFGFVVVAAPLKALGIAPRVAYNLAVPMLFALTACAAFSIGMTVHRTLGAADRARLGDVLPVRRTVAAGLAAAIFVVLLGNLGEVRVVVPALRQIGGGQGAVSVIKGLASWAGGTDLPIRAEWPYWNPTRLTPKVPIAEFPQFTFLYGDLHAHMMGMPLALLALAFALALAGGARWPAMVLGALVVGAIWPTNTWDYPIYLLLCLGGIAIAAAGPPRGDWRRRLGAVPAMVVFALLTRLFFVPYFQHFGSAYTKIGVWKGDTTPLWAYLTIYATFLVPLVVALIAEHRLALATLVATRWRPPSWRRFDRRNLAVIAALAVSATLAGAALYRGASIAVVAVPFMVAAAAAVLNPGPGERRLVWLAVAGALALTLGVELFVLTGDLGRMNTQFKAYLQVWLLLGTVSGALLVHLWGRLTATVHAARARARDAGARALPAAAVGRPSLGAARLARATLLAAATITIALAALYPLVAIPAKIRDRWVADAPRGLDGAAYMRLAVQHEAGDGHPVVPMPLEHDLDTIEWLLQNLEGTPTVLEGTTGGYQYRWGNRISIYTGLPTLVGWEWHQRQQRGALNDRVVYDRNADVTELYGATDPARALTLLRRYDVDYVILGQMERAYYDSAGLEKFVALENSGHLRRVHENPGNIVFQVVSTI